MKKNHGITWIIAIVVSSIFITQFSAMAADKVVIIPLFSSGDEIPTVTTETGRVWMDRNLGAIRVAGSMSDSLAYGWLYQWGRPADGHESRTSPVTDSENEYSEGDVPGHGNFIIISEMPLDWRDPQKNTLWQGKNGINNPCPPDFRLPTELEWKAEIEKWATKNAEGAFGSRLKLTLGGQRTMLDGEIDDAGHRGSYWTADTSGMFAKLLSVQQASSSVTISLRSAGYAVRCIKD